LEDRWIQHTQQQIVIPGRTAEKPRRTAVRLLLLLFLEIGTLWRIMLMKVTIGYADCLDDSSVLRDKRERVEV